MNIIQREYERGTMAYEVARGLLKTAIGRQIFCKCEQVLDVDKASLCTLYDLDEKGNPILGVKASCHTCVATEIEESPGLSKTLEMEIEFPPKMDSKTKGQKTMKNDAILTVKQLKEISTFTGDKHSGKCSEVWTDNKGPDNTLRIWATNGHFVLVHTLTVQGPKEPTPYDVQFIKKTALGEISVDENGLLKDVRGILPLGNHVGIEPHDIDRAIPHIERTTVTEERPSAIGFNPFYLARIGKAIQVLHKLKKADTPVARYQFGSGSFDAVRIDYENTMVVLMPARLKA